MPCDVPHDAWYYASQAIAPFLAVGIARGIERGCEWVEYRLWPRVRRVLAMEGR
jgi:hypothetical protein